MQSDVAVGVGKDEVPRGAGSLLRGRREGDIYSPCSKVLSTLL
jgi:hypothetical protein